MDFKLVTDGNTRKIPHKACYLCGCVRRRNSAEVMREAERQGVRVSERRGKEKKRREKGEKWGLIVRTGRREEYMGTRWPADWRCFKFDVDL